MISRILATINALTAATNRQSDLIERQIAMYSRQADKQNEANDRSNHLSCRHLEIADKRLQMDLAARFAKPPTAEEIAAQEDELIRRIYTKFCELDKKEGTK